MDVIVADDDLTQRTYLGALLARAGHTPIPAADGTEALERLGQGDASLVICDIEMPGFDGIELARRVRARSYGRYVYLILITARDRSEDFAAGLNAGADDFMPKPVDPAVLMVRLAAAERVIAYDRELGARTARLADAIRQLESDLAAGAEAQRALLPAPDHRLNAMRARSVFIPSRFVSGDVFNYFSLDATRAGFYAADVSGHGVRAALLAVAVGHLLRRESFAAMTLGGDVPAPHSLIAELNRRFVDRDASEDEYLTMIAGVADEVRDELTICRAGHPPPLVFDRDGRTRRVEGGDLPVGLFAAAAFESVTVPFGPGDRLVVFSDGIIEAIDASGEPFGEERLAGFLRPRLAAPPPALTADLTACLAAWTESTVITDDISMIILER